MFQTFRCLRVLPAAWLLAVGTLFALPAGAVPDAPDASAPIGDFPNLPPQLSGLFSPAPGSAVAIPLGLAVQRGLWTKACGMALDTLARQNSDLNALGVFAVCSAITQDAAATGAALQRLQQTEGAGGYHVQLVNSVRLLRAGSPQQAETALRALLKAYPGDPLTFYFLGVALRAEQRTDEAIVYFRKQLQQWPDYGPALIAVADLSAGPAATDAELKSAIVLTEHATRIEPMNVEYWIQLAGLYDRLGEHERASAIRLQWVNTQTR